MSRMVGVGSSFVLNTRLTTVIFALLKQHASVVLAFKLSSKASTFETSCVNSGCVVANYIYNKLANYLLLIAYDI